MPTVVLVGTLDTKGSEYAFLRDRLREHGVDVVLVDCGIVGEPLCEPDVRREEVAAAAGADVHALAAAGDRGAAVAAMGDGAAVIVTKLHAEGRLDGILGLGGSGNSALATQAMRALPVGVPKLMVSTVASGDVKPYVGPADICMMYSVTDVSGINRISEKVLANAAHALAGMIAFHRKHKSEVETKPAIGLTMFGLTTPCVQAVCKQLEERYDCIVFHATGTGGQAMEKLADSGLLAGVLDITTTEVTDEIVGGVLSAGPGRLDAFIDRRIPYVGSLGAVDMCNFWAYDTVPSRFAGRTLYRHNPNVTLMRTTAEEAQRIGRFIVEKLNRMQGPVRFLIPEGGLSLIDAPGKPFWDPAADKALFGAIEAKFRSGANRKLIRLPHHINDAPFADALVSQFNELAQQRVLTTA